MFPGHIKTAAGCHPPSRRVVWTLDVGPDGLWLCRLPGRTLPATTSVTLKRGQEILAGAWHSGNEATKDGKPCK